MDDRIQALVTDVENRLHLESFTLKSTHIFKEEHFQGQFSYILNTEWVPANAEDTEDFNPEGTASIDMDMESRKLKRITFVGRRNDTESDLPVSGNTESIIKWVEKVTDLEFERQFKLIHEEEKELLFQAAIDNIAVFPSGSIEVEFNEEGKLSMFAINGNFPHEDQLNWEPFTLTLEEIEPFMKSQLQLFEIPVEEEEKWMAMYGTATAFITNDGKQTITFEEVERSDSHTDMDVTLEWGSSLPETFTKKAVELSVEVTAEEAFAQEEGNMDQPLTDKEQQQTLEGAIRFLRMEFPEESGQWRLSSIWKEKGYIFAELVPAAKTPRVITHKLSLVLDPEDFEVATYTDNSVIIDMFRYFKEADEATVNKEEAYEKMRKHIEITPTYVYDQNKKHYILCGKIDSHYGINAASGDVVLLDEL